MKRPIRSAYSKALRYITKSYLPVHLTVCDKLVDLFGTMYGPGEYHTALCNALQVQRVVIESMIGYVDDLLPF